MTFETKHKRIFGRFSYFSQWETWFCWVFATCPGFKRGTIARRESKISPIDQNLMDFYAAHSLGRWPAVVIFNRNDWVSNRLQTHFGFPFRNQKRQVQLTIIDLVIELWSNYKIKHRTLFGILRTRAANTQTHRMKIKWLRVNCVKDVLYINQRKSGCEEKKKISISHWDFMRTINSSKLMIQLGKIRK